MAAHWLSSLRGEAFKGRSFLHRRKVVHVLLTVALQQGGYYALALSVHTVPNPTMVEDTTLGELSLVEAG